MLAWTGLFGLAVLLVGLVLLFLWHPRMGELFHRHVRDRPKRRLFLAAVGFFLTLALARGAAYAAARGIAPFHYIYIRGTHVHHLVWGILLLLIVGFCWLIEVGTGERSSSLLASRLSLRSRSRSYTGRICALAQPEGHGLLDAPGPRQP